MSEDEQTPGQVVDNRGSTHEQQINFVAVEPSQLRPYRGLKVFREQHVRWLFGRDEELAKLVELVGKQSLLTVIGASGSDKSSLVLGGLCAAMRCGMLGERIEKIATMRPGKRPCWVLAEALAGLEPSLDALSRGAKVDEMVEGMKRSNERLRAVAGQLGGAGAERKVLLVVDQLEELFTESRLGMEGETDEAMAFVRNIIAATSGDDAPLRVVSTLRSDFVPHYLRIAEFATITSSSSRLGRDAWRPAATDELPQSGGVRRPRRRSRTESVHAAPDWHAGELAPGHRRGEVPGFGARPAAWLEPTPDTSGP
jgi:hypothetical protein